MFSAIGSALFQRDADRCRGGPGREYQSNEQECAEQGQVRRRQLMPAMLAATAPAPKISTGMYSGSTSSASRPPAPRTPRVRRRADRADQRQHRRAEQQAERHHAQGFAGKIELQSQHAVRSAPAARPSPASAQGSCASARTSSGCGLSASCSSVPSA